MGRDERKLAVALAERFERAEHRVVAVLASHDASSQDVDVHSRPSFPPGYGDLGKAGSAQHR